MSRGTSGLLGRRATGGLVAVCVVALAMAGPVAADSSPPVAPPSPPPAPGAPAVLPPTAVVGSTAPVPTAAGVAAALTPALRGAGTVRAVVLDPADGTVLLDQGASTPSTPASTAKLLTALAALTALGPDTRLRTRVVAGGADAVVLVGAGDATLARSRSTLDGGTPSATMAALATATAAALKARGTRSVSVSYDDRLFTGPRLSPAWSAGLLAVGEVGPVTALSVDQGRVSPGSTSRVADPPLAAARFFAERLSAAGIEVRGAVARSAGAVPGDATEIAGVDSPPVANLVEHMLTASDDDLAEALAHLAGGRLAGSASFEGGAEATATALAGYGIPTDGLELSDGSGLARADSVMPATIAGVLRASAAGAAPTDVAKAAGAGPVLWPIGTGVPVAGFTGTLADRFVGTKAVMGRGVVRAKTGTLTGVSALAGLVRDIDGRLLAFVFLASDTPAKETAQGALDRAAAALAGCGCR